MAHAIVDAESHSYIELFLRVAVRDAGVTPRCIVTDDDNAEWKAIATVFGSSTSHKLCQFHIKKNWCGPFPGETLAAATPSFRFFILVDLYHLLMLVSCACITVPVQAPNPEQKARDPQRSQGQSSACRHHEAFAPKSV